MKIYFHYDLDSHDLLSSLVLNQFIFEKNMSFLQINSQTIL